MSPPLHFHGHPRPPLPRESSQAGPWISLLISIGAHTLLAAVALVLVLWHGLHPKEVAPPAVAPTELEDDLTTVEPEPGSTEVDALAGGPKIAPPTPDREAAPPPPEKALAEGTPTPNEPVVREEPDAPRETPHVAKPPEKTGPVASSLPVEPAADPSPAGVPGGVSTEPPSASAEGASHADAGAVLGSGGPGDGGLARTAPSVAPRFTKELAAYAAHVPGWQDAPLGKTASLDVTLELDANGHVVTTRDPSADVPSPDALLAESARRTAKSLLLVMSLPDHPVGAGTVVLRLGGVVSDRAPPNDVDPNGIAFAFDFAGKTGTASFTLATGRHVEIGVEVLRVEPK